MLLSMIATVAGSLSCSRCPHHSDVIATSRSVHYARDHGTYTTWGAMAAFEATRLDWVYNTNASFVTAAHEDHDLEITLAMNPQCADGPHANPSDPNTIGRVLNIHGERLVAPWMRSWNPPHRYYGCVNAPEYLNIAMDFGAELLHLGSDGVQHDDPGSNYESTLWNRGDPTVSGCYCQHCMSGFTSALSRNLSAASRAALNITDEFNYKALLLQEAWNGTNPTVVALRPLFVAYQANVTKTYLRTLKSHLDATAAALPTPRTTALSCNKGQGGWAMTMACDFILGELAAKDATPEGLEAFFTPQPAGMLPHGKSQVMTMPKMSNATLVATEAFEVLIRTATAYAYALGTALVVPWDIYLPTPEATRYYGTVAQYGDIFGFVRQHAALLDAAVVAVPNASVVPSSGGEPKRYNHTFTGGSGSAGKPKMGMRYRFPFPYTTASYKGERINGSRWTEMSLLSCEYMCDSIPTCAGIQFQGSECYTLNGNVSLVECHTTLKGDSYARVPGASRSPGRRNPNSSAVSSEAHVRVRVRRAVNRSFATVHVVDWRLALPSIWMTGVLPRNRTFPPFELNISHAILSSASAGHADGGDASSSMMPPCGELAFVLHTLRLNRSATGTPGASVAVSGVCVGNVTILKLPSPQPWSLLEVRPKPKLYT